MKTDYQVVIADSKGLLSKAFKVREEVFIVEQKVQKEEEFDEFEMESTHFVALEPDGDPIGAARWRKTSIGIKLERFAVVKTSRGRGVGAALVAAVIEDILSKEGENQLMYLHAQLEAVPLYEKFGFKKKGDLFEECNIWHYTMERIKNPI